MSLSLASHPLPTAWDGRSVKWDRWESAAEKLFICPPPETEHCECGSTSRPFTSRGLRDPDPKLVQRLERVPRIERRIRLAYPTYSLYAFRCRDCGVVEVWDIESDEWWTLDESDYGPTGSTRSPTAPAE